MARFFASFVHKSRCRIEVSGALPDAPKGTGTLLGNATGLHELVTAVVLRIGTGFGARHGIDLAAGAGDLGDHALTGDRADLHREVVAAHADGVEPAVHAAGLDEHLGCGSVHSILLPLASRAN